MLAEADADGEVKAEGASSRRAKRPPLRAGGSSTQSGHGREVAQAGGNQSGDDPGYPPLGRADCGYWNEGPP